MCVAPLGTESSLSSESVGMKTSRERLLNKESFSVRTSVGRISECAWVTFNTAEDCECCVFVTRLIHAHACSDTLLYFNGLYMMSRLFPVW